MYLALGLALAWLAAAMMAMIVGEYGRGGKFRIVLASLLLLLYLFALLKGLTREELGVALGALAFVAVWALVMKMDNRHAVKAFIR
jgi:alkylhydroperoxidase/carboxymuconolactone decarboxylase family protein YurZ